VKKIKSIKMTDKLRQKYRDKHICQRCNSPFETDEELQHHRLYQHGEVASIDNLRDIKGKESHRIPHKKDWVIIISDTKFWWYTPWRHCNDMYILGTGCLSNELYSDIKDKHRMKEMIICDDVNINIISPLLVYLPWKSTQ